MMRKKIHSQLWIYLACMIFGMLVITIFLLGLAVATFYHFDLVGINKGGPIRWIVLFGFFSVVIGTGVAVFVGRRILYPITRLSEEMRIVAEGDFSIQLEEDQKISEVEQLFHDFNLMVKELNNIETLRNDFVSNVSHEFKTPIATIRGYVQLLQNNNLSEADRQEYLSRIFDGTHQLSRLTENILKLTKIETQGVSLEEKEFRLDEQIRNVILFLEPEWEGKNLDWCIEMKRSFYFGNEEFLYQVWLNVISNAIKYNRIDGQIQVGLVEKSDWLEVAVRDNGIGMDMETQKHMFDKFFQGDTSRKTKGNGLGMTLAKRIIDIYQGQILVSSSEGEGTSIVIKLPKKNLKSPVLFTNS